MTTAGELLKQGRKDEIWQKYCGFIDLSLTEFMDIQKRLLMDQLDLLGKCELGQKLLGGKVPATLEEFRQNVPLTTYKDYIPYLSEKREEALPVKPHVWARTSGRMGEYAVKWIPYSPGFYSKLGANILAACAFGSSDRRGVFTFDEGDFIFAAIAPPPYLSGAVVA
ncbi:MAG: GH3 auxin-responsive promoter family protein, partial [Anaerolineae bacterium]